MKMIVMMKLIKTKRYKDPQKESRSENIDKD